MKGNHSCRESQYVICALQKSTTPSCILSVLKSFNKTSLGTSRDSLSGALLVFWDPEQNRTELVITISLVIINLGSWVFFIGCLLMKENSLADPPQLLV